VACDRFTRVDNGKVLFLAGMVGSGPETMHEIGERRTYFGKLHIATVPDLLNRARIIVVEVLDTFVQMDGKTATEDM
jgi:hypothetical protein